MLCIFYFKCQFLKFVLPDIDIDFTTLPNIDLDESAFNETEEQTDTAPQEETEDWGDQNVTTTDDAMLRHHRF